MSQLPKNYDHVSRENYWRDQWVEKKVFAYQSDSKQERYVIDTPPPTVSGSLHVGHVFSYTQTDIIARYQRMLGKNVFYPIGWDDNGLPTERRVQNIFGIKCSSTLPYDASWKAAPVAEKNKEIKEVSRQNFLEACHQQTLEDEKKYQALWQKLGLSIDWDQQYETINEHCRKVSQYSFLDLVKKGYCYTKEAPTMWDTEFQTAIAQAEVEDREVQGLFHDIRFQVEGGGDFVISTTRPELLPACIAVVAHPDDERFKPLFGKKAISPLFHADVPILPAEHADPEKGTGILMVCTFGDVHDVDYWKKSGLPLKQVITRNGKMASVEFGKGVFNSTNPSAANAVMVQLAGLYIKQARKKFVDLLKECGALVGDPKPTLQAVRHYEKGEHPLQYISTRQWFVKVVDYKKELLEMGRQVCWHPEHMVKKYENWVEGLQVDWCISRQRFFGVPFPVWYPLSAQAEPDYDKAIYADEKLLPLDPQMSCPPGFTEDQRGKANGFIGDPDVMDTWATSSVTPQISSHWTLDDKRHQELFPASLRPQAHEIIRTWAFYTIAKSWMHFKKIPWKDIAISGWVVNPNREKMSKSKGNTVTPEQVIEQYSADAVRYWAAKARLGSDTIYSEEMFKIGKRLSTKLFNVAKFVHLQLTNQETGVVHAPKLENVTVAIDRVWLAKVNELINYSTRHFDSYDYAGALSETESLFWEFCDFYIELVKGRAYQERDQAAGLSALSTLGITLDVFLKLLAPITPYICDEIWNWWPRENSLHHNSWPTPFYKDQESDEQRQFYQATSEIVSQVRATKTSAQKNLKWPVAEIMVMTSEALVKSLESVEQDIAKVSNLKGKIAYTTGATPEGLQTAVTIVLAESAE